MENGYIKLPVVKKIEVLGYGLFRDDWHYEFKKGLNLFVGGNRLGKTTTVYILLYGLIGIPRTDKSFFIDRVLPDRQSKHQKPSVKLLFDIGDSSIEIERDLSDSHIRYLSINGSLYTEEETSNIEGIYSREIVRLAGISSLNDWQNLLGEFLIREEEGTNLLWNADSQIKILRLLFNYGKYASEVAELTRRVREADSEVRDQQYFRSKVRSRRDAFKTERARRLKELGQVDQQKLEERLQVLTRESNKLRDSYDSIIKYIEEKEQYKKQCTQNVSGLSNEIEELESEVMNIENKFFRSVYEDPKIQLAGHKLRYNQICIFCNQKISTERAKNVLKDIEGLRKCPVCGSGIGKAATDEISIEERKKLVELLIDLRKKADDKSKEYSLNKANLDAVTKELSQIWAEKETIRKQLEDMTFDIDDINLMLSKPEMEKKQEEISHYDRDIRTLEKEMDYYLDVINSARKRKEKASQELVQKSKEFDEILENISSNLVTKFKKYVGSFFDDCELVVKRWSTRDSIIDFNLFVPKFGGRERIYAVQVSRSEAIFLDYAFRLSLCELYKQITGNESLLVIETSEGLFDTANAPILAENISKFFEISYLLIISNLGRPDFLEALVKKTKEHISDRVLNYFEIGRLSQVQEKEKDKFNDQLQRVLKR
jgi:DNA repair exonuclease SbcCD ATPase subunit